MARTLVLPRTRLVNRNGKCAEAQAVVTKCGTRGNLAKDLVSVRCDIGSRASNKASVKVQVPERIAVCGSSPAEACLFAARGDGRAVCSGVAQRTVRRNIDLLATGDHDTEREGLVAASEDRGVARWAVGRADRLDRAVGAGWSAAEVELVAACGEGEKVDGRGRA